MEPELFPPSPKYWNWRASNEVDRQQTQGEQKRKYFFVQVTKMWNLLPEDTMTPTGIDCFKRYLWTIGLSVASHSD